MHPSLNRDNPGFREYYQTLADVITIFWEFHKERLTIGDTVFAHGELDKIPYDAGKDYKKLARGRLMSEYPPIDQFIMHAQIAMKDSWIDFLKGLTLVQPENKRKFNVPESCKRFMHPYVYDLVVHAQELGEKYSKFETGHEYRVQTGVVAGIDTGVRVTTQLSAIFGEDFNPLDPVRISKVSLEKVGYATGGIGRHTEDVPATSYYMLHPEQRLNTDMLRQLDYGKAEGCPAGLPSSAQTKKFLREECGIEVKGTMLEDFARVLHTEFNQSVRSWVENLHPRQRQDYLRQEERRLLEGKVWAPIKTGEVDFGQGCPFSRERKG